MAVGALTSKGAEGELAVEAVAMMRRSSGALLNADLEVATARAKLVAFRFLRTKLLLT
jgi:hypothetical protein